VETLCLGEAVVDLVAEGAVGPRGEAARMHREPGGAAATVARNAARLGARTALAGGAGDDADGRWLRDRLAADGVGLDSFHLRPGVRTPVAFVRAGEDGEPVSEIRGDAPAEAVGALAREIDTAVDKAAALVIGSRTLADEAARAVTMGARDRALRLERPVILDVTFRRRGWRTAAEAAGWINACVPGALLVRATREEAELLTGERDPERAALALRKAGARLVAISLGAEGAILRGGKERADAGGGGPAPAAGTGGALTGTLVARLALAGFYPAAAATALREAVAAGARPR
jgi:fructokinase